MKVLRMLRTKSLLIFAAAGAALLLVGCQTTSTVDDLLEGRKIDYPSEENQTAQALQLPPDILSDIEPVGDSIALSEYQISQVPDLQAIEVAEESKVIAVRYRRSGNIRWVETDLSPEALWAQVRYFWQEVLQFPVAEEKPRLGIMETDWLDLRKRLESPGLLGNWLSGILNQLEDSGVRDRFISRIERNESGGADVFITHRNVAAQFSGRDSLFSGYEPLPANPELEIEMLRRLMLHLAEQGDTRDPDAQAPDDIDEAVADAEQAGTARPFQHEDDILWVDKPFLESWQYVQIGLERGGFSIEDRDFTDRWIIIQHSGGPETDEIFGKVEGGFLNKLFGDEKPILRDIIITFEPVDAARTKITLSAPEDEDELTPIQASVLLELLAQNLP